MLDIIEQKAKLKDMLQFNRKFSAVVADKSGQGLELFAPRQTDPNAAAPEGLRVTFQVYKKTVETANGLVLRVYNLSDKTANLIREEFQQIEVRAGYSNATGANFGTIFRGSVIYFIKGRINQTDTFLDIYASEGDLAMNYGVINKTLAANHTQADVQNSILEVFKQYGVTQGNTAPLPDTRMPRGVAMWGMAKDYARDHAFTNGLTWGINEGQYETLPLHGTLPGDPILLTSQSGLIGMPRQTPGGIIATCLLNPRLRHNCVIKLDNASIQRFPPSAPFGTDAGTHVFYKLPGIDRDGLFRVLGVDHVGDTRGTPWYSEVYCIALDATLHGLDHSVVHMDVGPEGRPSDPRVQDIGDLPAIG